MRIWAALGVLIGLTAAGPAIVTVPGGCGSGTNICFGSMQVPAGQQASFTQGGQMAIDAVRSPSFRADLTAFIANDAQTGPQAAAWKGLTANAIIAQLLQKMRGLTVTTFGGPTALQQFQQSGNIAFDGAGSGPIRLNQYALPRPAPALANTFAHEASHRFGLAHPHSNMHDMRTAQCEPPYVIGSLVKKAAMGAGWVAGASDCYLLRG